VDVIAFIEHNRLRTGLVVEQEAGSIRSFLVIQDLKCLILQLSNIKSTDRFNDLILY